MVRCLLQTVTVDDYNPVRLLEDTTKNTVVFMPSPPRFTS